MLLAVAYADHRQVWYKVFDDQRRFGVHGDVLAQRLAIPHRPLELLGTELQRTPDATAW